MARNQQDGSVSSELLPLPETFEDLRPTPRATPRDVFTKMDSDLIRVIEDLAFVLIDKGLIKLDDLPERARTKLLERRGFRERFQALGARHDGFIDVLDDSKFGRLR